MKLVDSSKFEKKFTPVVLTITLESEAELQEFYHRMNTRSSVIHNEASRSEIPLPLHPTGLKTNICDKLRSAMKQRDMPTKTRLSDIARRPSPFPYHF